jgi:hypothetical protein
MADRSRCPSCGERVSPYAAGCAVCGADLDPSRWDTGPGLGNRIGSTLTALTYRGPSGNGVRWLVIGFLLVFVGTPILALLGLL